MNNIPISNWKREIYFNEYVRKHTHCMPNYRDFSQLTRVVFPFKFLNVIIVEKSQTLMIFRLCNEWFVWAKN